MDRHQWDERYASTDRRFTPDPNGLIVPDVLALRPGRALDLGCGEGRHTVWLASLGWRVVGVDFSTVGLARAQARARAEGLRAAFAAADVGTLHLRGGFDLVLASFFHPGSYAFVAGALAPGGTLLIVSYDITNLTEGAGGPQDPAHLIRRPDVTAELTGAGLRVERAETVRVGDAVDAVIRAVRPDVSAAVGARS